MQLTPNIQKAAFLLSKISIFDMDPTLVHTYVLADCMVHGVHAVTTWEKTIALLDQLAAGKCPKKAVLTEAKELLLVDQMGVAMLKANPTMVIYDPPKFKADAPDAPKFKADAPDAPKFKAGFSYGNVAAPAPAPIPVIPMPAPTPSAQTSESGDITKLPCAVQTVGVNILVKCPYNPSFLGTLKTLPIQDRKWDQTKKVWVVSLTHKAWVVNLMKETYGYVQELTA